MVLWAVAATVVAACSLLILILYRRQVKKTCRQLAFLREHTTNLRLTGGLPFSEWEELVDGVNAILDQAREGRRTAQREEAALKEAITHLSHDIRTPLTSLDGYFQLLLQSPSAEEQQRYSAVIQSRIASLRDMLEELFTYARLQDKEAPLALEPVDFAACVYDTVFAFYEDFQAKGLTPQAGPGQFLFLYPLGAVGDGILLHLGVQIPQQLVTVVQKDHRLPQIVLIGAVKGRRVRAGEALLLEKHLEPLGEQFRLGDLSPLQLPPVPRV